MTEIPERLGVFPLPHVVLFPDTLLPLHVFEPRYRALVKSALEGSGRFVMAILKPGYEDDYHGSPDVYRCACAGRIVDHELLPDGRSDLILQGERVVEIEEFVSDAPFRTARVRARTRDLSFVEGPGASDRIDELQQLLEEACPGCVEALAERMTCDTEAERGLQLLHTIAMHLPVGVPRKIDWLCQPGTLKRWQAIRETLKRMGAERNLREHTIARYSDQQPSDPNRN
jgi:Lon protease-like protein